MKAAGHKAASRELVVDACAGQRAVHAYAGGAAELRASLQADEPRAHVLAAHIHTLHRHARAGLCEVQLMGQNACALKAHPSSPGLTLRTLWVSPN